MTTKLRQKPFNMVEIVIALVIILIALVSVLSLLPKSIDSSNEAVGRIAAGDSADQVLSYLATRVASDWEGELAAFPTTNQGFPSESSVVWGRSAGDNGEELLPNTSLLLEFNGANEAAAYDPSAVNGLFRITQQTSSGAKDFVAVSRIWMELDVVHADPDSLSKTEQIAAATSAKLNAEVSWPADIPYEKRKRATYSLTVFRPVASGVPASTTDDCIKTGEISGTASLCPTNNSDFSFEMRTTGGSVITRDTLHSKGSSYTFTGTATYIRFCPKANGNSDSTLTVSGDAYEINNKKCYTLNGDAIQVKLWNDKTNGRALGHWLLDISPSGATIEGSCGDELAVTETEEEEEETETFEIEGGVITPQVPVNTTFDVLGCAITSGGTPCIVTASITIDDKVYEPFGDTGVKVTGSWRSRTVSAPGNINDGQPHEYDAGLLQAGLDITVTGFSYTPSGSKIMEQGSEANQNCMVLRHGDAVPDIDGFEDQDAVETYLQDYINTENNTVTLQANQAILLFELGTTNLSSSAADFQDMVMVVTMTPEEK